MNGAKRSAEAVGCKNASVGERFRLRGKDPREQWWTKRKRECRLELGEIDMSVKMRTTCTWTERPYEASLFPGIGFGPFLRSLGGRRRRPPSGGARAISEIPLWKS
ncbi:Imp biosynthesis protein [Quillaja saponaria]|uniref:Imp biosynthesis protein n=1 Tax=Quillaja saponaria TaxID=32244 RepID=A0AAD7KLQ4_QUISA|nr:Imp biosynthesis protein [Quillaja saponaria]